MVLHTDCKISKLFVFLFRACVVKMRILASVLQGEGCVRFQYRTQWVLRVPLPDAFGSQLKKKLIEGYSMERK